MAATLALLRFGTESGSNQGPAIEAKNPGYDFLPLSPYPLSLIPAPRA